MLYTRKRHFLKQLTVGRRMTLFTATISSFWRPMSFHNKILDFFTLSSYLLTYISLSFIIYFKTKYHILLFLRYLVIFIRCFLCGPKIKKQTHKNPLRLIVCEIQRISKITDFYTKPLHLKFISPTNNIYRLFKIKYFSKREFDYKQRVKIK